MANVGTHQHSSTTGGNLADACKAGKRVLLSALVPQLDDTAHAAVIDISLYYVWVLISRAGYYKGSGSGTNSPTAVSAGVCQRAITVCGENCSHCIWLCGSHSLYLLDLRVIAERA